MKVYRTIVLTLAALATPVLAQSAKPWTFSFGGQLIDGGKAVAGSAAIELRFYKEATGGTPLPVTPVTFTNVPLQDGVFQVDATMLGAAELDMIFGGDKPTWVEVVANGKVYFRQMVVAVPYALRVPVDEKRVAFDQTSGKLTVGPKSNAQPGEFLTQTSAGDWTWQTPTVTSAAAATISGKTVDAAVPTAPGQVLRYDGTSWKPDSLLPQTVAADTNKFLKYDGGKFVWDTPAGAGDMQKLTYDGNNNGIVNDAEKLGGNPPSFYRDASNLNAGSVPAAQLPVATAASLGALRATAGKLVLDGSGAVTSITADTATSFSGSLVGDVTGTQAATTIAANAVTSAKIADDSIVDADVNSGAAISRSKLATTGDLALAESTGTAARLKFQEPGGPDWITLRAPSASVSYDLQLPTTAGNPGDVLKTDGSGGLSWYSLTNHSAQGAPGQIQFKGATGFSADSNFVYTSNKLGIGTSVPFDKLTVSGGSVLLENGAPGAGDGKFRTQTSSASVAPEFRAHRSLAGNTPVNASVVLGDFSASGIQNGGSETIGGSVQVITTEDWSLGGGRGSKVVIRAIKDGTSTLTNALAVYGGHVAFGGGQVHKIRVDGNASVPVAADDHVLIVTATGAVTVTLPSCGSGIGGGRVLLVRKQSGTSGALALTGGSALPGGTALTAANTRTLMCDSTSTGTWYDL